MIPASSCVVPLHFLLFATDFDVENQSLIKPFSERLEQLLKNWPVELMNLFQRYANGLSSHFVIFEKESIHNLKDRVRRQRGSRDVMCPAVKFELSGDGRS
jgi:hypothetical protein